MTCVHVPLSELDFRILRFCKAGLEQITDQPALEVQTPSAWLVLLLGCSFGKSHQTQLPELHQSGPKSSLEHLW